MKLRHQLIQLIRSTYFWQFWKYPLSLHYCALLYCRPDGKLANPTSVHCGNNLCYDLSNLPNVQCAGVRSVRSPTSGWRKHKLLGSLKISAINIFSVKMVWDKWWQSDKSCVLTSKYCRKSSKCTVLPDLKIWNHAGGHNDRRKRHSASQKWKH